MSPNSRSFDEEKGKDEMKKKMKKVKEVSHVLEHLNKKKLLWGLSATVKVPQIQFIAGV